MSGEFVFVTRYGYGRENLPDPETCCPECEGMGWYPSDNKLDPRWQEAHREHCTPLGWLKSLWKYRDDVSFWWSVRRGWWSCDGEHACKCPVCNGTKVRA